MLTFRIFSFWSFPAFTRQLEQRLGSYLNFSFFKNEFSVEILNSKALNKFKRAFKIKDFDRLTGYLEKSLDKSVSKLRQVLNNFLVSSVHYSL